MLKTIDGSCVVKVEILEEQLQLVLKECERLRLENQTLKELLKYHNISPDTTPYFQKTKEVAITKEQKIQERMKIYQNLFKGRTDIYAVRWEAKNGKSGYMPACENEWHTTLCQKPTIKCSNCQNRKLLPLTDQDIYDHLSGRKTIGLYPLLQDETSWFLAVDFDKKNWSRDVQSFIETCKELDVPASIERSRSGNGCHVWIFFNQAVPAFLARNLGNVLLSKTLSKCYEVGMDSYDRLFPNQDTLPKGGFGNLIALPLQNGPRKNGNSVFVDEHFIPYPDQWHFLHQIRKMKIEDINEIIKTYHLNNDSSMYAKDIQPLTNEDKFQLSTYVTVIEKNGLYIPKKGLSSSLIHKLMQLGTFKNPEFYKTQAKRLSTHNIPRNITCYDHTEEYLILPRGCKDDILNLLKEVSIDYDFVDGTNSGNKISLKFEGNLRTEQEQAVTKLLENPIGILSATTGFGKTVIAAALIAKRQTNTLIIVHRNQLIDQWKKSLSTFQNLEEKQIGRIGGGKNKQTGIIDIATIQSLNHKGEVKELVTKYGQIIVDECHHIAAFSFEQVLKKVNAKYILGLTATPIRKDGLHPIMTMQLGPVRYKVNAKDQSKISSFEQILIPRYTKFKSDEKDIQKIYSELTKDESRNQMIFEDVLRELENGSAPIILTERVEHAIYLESKFKGFVKNVIILTGRLSKKEEKENLKILDVLVENEERLIIATGKYIGEGFDYARLDSLFLVMPFSWKGTLQQYVGRLHRQHDSKSKVKVYDYVDCQVQMFKVMFEKRLKSYRSLGYRLLENKSIDKTLSEQMRLF
ncbi:TOTE conflict system archaeo-eukaryotic primase domain-containing protein [Lysinibacillus sp. NPDC097231]|uniref:TOTE conflict system archaeo-eukaryotic primase domain-containing protein n=1 Tax=Lysinibacillus sp. NPDC097231 TaxID=3364142 RepID=UPI00381885B5